MADYDVIVAGSGTGGATAAYTLAKYGRSVLVVDRKERSQIGNKTCGDAIGGHHLRELKELVGLPDLPRHIIEYDVNGIDLVAPDRKHRLRMKGPTTTGYSFNRLKMGQWFVDLAEKTGTEVMSSTRVKRLLFDGGKVCGLRVESEDTHQEKDITARVVIDATGASGVLRRQLPESSPIEREVAKEDMMVAWREIYETPDYEFSTPEILDIIWDQEQTLGGYTWVFPQGKHRVNVGCGVMTLPNHRQPKSIYESYVRPNWEFMSTKLNLIHSGGGVAPVRRPIDTLVDDNFMLVGDSGCQVNPVHGGGIGSSMLGGAHAGITASEALERKDTSKESLWPYNPRYMASYGIKQASLDIFRWFLLNVTNDDINYVFRKEIIKGSDLLAVSMTGKMEMALGEKFKRLVSGAGKVSLLKRVNRVAHLMEDIKAVYSEYPDNPKGLLEWKSRLKPIYEAAKKA